MLLYFRRRTLARMRHRAYGHAEALEHAGKLAGGGVGLSGWINKRVSGGQANAVEELEYHGLQALIVGLSAYARQNGVTLNTNEAVSEALA